MEIKVNRLVREGGKLITEAEFVGAILSGGKGKAVILLLHFLVQGGPLGVLQTTVHIVVATSDHLKERKTQAGCLKLQVINKEKWGARR